MDRKIKSGRHRALVKKRNQGRTDHGEEEGELLEGV